MKFPVFPLDERDIRRRTRLCLAAALLGLIGCAGCKGAEPFRLGNHDALPSPGLGTGGSIEDGTGGGTGGEPFGSGGAGGSGTGGLDAAGGSGGAGGSGTGGLGAAGSGGVGAPAGSGGSPSSRGGSAGDAPRDTAGDTGSGGAANDRGGNVGDAGNVGDVGLPDPGLVGYWKLDDGASPIADSSGSGTSGTLFNAPMWGAGPTLKVPNVSALVLNGTNQYASLGNPAVLNFSGQITMAAWIKASATDGARNIVAHGHDASSEVFLRISNGLYGVGSWLSPSGGGANYAIPGGDVGTWIHLAGVYDGTAWRLYRNGVEVVSSVAPFGAVPVMANWAIGARGDGTSRWFAGSIDDVRIYKRALSAAEIADLHSR